MMVRAPRRSWSAQDRQGLWFFCVRLLGGLLAIAVLAVLLFKPQHVLRFHGKSGSLKLRSTHEDAKDTLVLYTFSNTDPEYYRNLDFFIRYGLDAVNVQFVFILQQLSGSAMPQMPALPENAMYLEHNNKCFDWGTIGWVIVSGRVDTRLYKYFIFMNSSVRGPFLPSYHQGANHWTSLYTERIRGLVKLVGSTINCQPIYWESNAALEMRQNPHVQSYVVATDQEGLKVLMDEENVFKCYESLQEVVWHSEVGASRAIFDAGYSIDALMLKYSGVDWRNKSNWKCNNWQNPYDDFAYDGTLINPLEVLFVKMKSYQLETDWITSKMAVTYERWQRSQGLEASVTHNEYDMARFSYYLSKGVTMSLRGSDCFDVLYYQKSNRDMPHDEATWQHFVHQGQFEGRPFRFTCASKFEHPAPLVLKQATNLARVAMNAAMQLDGHKTLDYVKGESS